MLETITMMTSNNEDNMRLKPQLIMREISRGEAQCNEC